MNKVIAAIAVALFAFVSTSAEAKHRSHVRHHNYHHSGYGVSAVVQGVGCTDNDGHPTYCGGTAQVRVVRGSGRTIRTASYGDERIVGHPAGCPRYAFCGCGASVRVFGHPVRELYLASNWFKFPHAAPAPGMVAVRNHHVFVIESVNGDGSVVAYDANSGGHATRIHTVSLSGYSVRNPNGARYAQR